VGWLVVYGALATAGALILLAGLTRDAAGNVNPGDLGAIMAGGALLLIGLLGLIVQRLRG
jgi:hypothetical protein